MINENRPSQNYMPKILYYPSEKLNLNKKQTQSGQYDAVLPTKGKNVLNYMKSENQQNKHKTLRGIANI